MPFSGFLFGQMTGKSGKKSLLSTPHINIKPRRVKSPPECPGFNAPGFRKFHQEAIDPARARCSCTGRPFHLTFFPGRLRQHRQKSQITFSLVRRLSPLAAFLENFGWPGVDRWVVLLPPCPQDEDYGQQNNPDDQYR